VREKELQQGDKKEGYKEKPAACELERTKGRGAIMRE
jgi:hypothetical protein